METGRSNYLRLAHELLGVAQDFINSSTVVSRYYHFGTKSVQVLAEISNREDRIDPLQGLLGIPDASFADYTIIFLDEVTTGYSPDVSRCDRRDSPLGQVRTSLTAPYRMALDIHTSSVLVNDPLSCAVVIWCADVNQYPYWAAATPFRLALAWIADTFDGEMLHGAAIERNKDCVVFPGKSGSGKSTLAFAVQEYGFRIISDDFFLFESGRIYPVYTRGKLHDTSLNYLPQNQINILNPNVINQKRIIQLDPEVLRTMCNGVSIKAFIVPQQYEEKGLTRTNSGAVFRHLAPYSSSGILGGLERSFLRTKRAISNKPAYQMHLKQPLLNSLDNLEEIFLET